MRGARWRLTASVEHADCRELHLRGGGGDTRVLLWPFDRPEAIAARPRVRLVPLHRWTLSAARALGRTLDPRAPRGRFTGDLLPYQLEPAIAIASGVSRVLLADEVGLGKTIQAGWILADLLHREPDARALIAVPASLREQWASELETLFALGPARVDAAWLRAAVADRAADVSPWAAPGVYLGSVDFLKRPDVTTSLADSTWDLLVVDEAHAAAAPTERHAALARIASSARRVVIITATPYSGDPAAFASMVALGALPGDGEPVLFRRSRDEVGDHRTRRHRFALLRIAPSEVRLQRLLERYTRDVWQHAPGDVDAARLAMTVLRKRALSSPAAALRSLSRRLELLRGSPTAPRQLSLFDEPEQPDEDLPEGALATPGLADAGLEQRWLTALVEAARRAALSDSKLGYLRRLLGRVPSEPVIVFTEYRDTLRRLAEALPGALQLHGGLSGSERSIVQKRFNDGGGILLATDAAADGLNLQRRCRMLVNYELPWNPARLEQRIGRVDRIGQRRRVHAVSLVARDTAEDLVVAALARRLARVSATLGERDRLASFLTDAITARAVIAGVAPAAGVAPGPRVAPAAGVAPSLMAEPAPSPSLPRPAPGDYPGGTIAAQIGAVRSDDRMNRSVAVARIGARSPAGAGCVAVLHAEAVNDRGTIAQRAWLVHISGALCPASVNRDEDEDAIVTRVNDVLARAGAALDVVREWFERTSALHRTAVEARLARERAIRDARSPRRELQPGLFDRRAVDARDREDGVAVGRHAEQTERLERLAGALELRLECSAAAVLVGWR